jgi:hypothetical protein
MSRVRRYAKVVEHLDGWGKLYTRAGDLIAEVEYSIQVWQEFIDGMEGKKDWQGTLYPMIDKKLMLGHENKYTLEVEDGTKVDIIIHDPSGDPITFESSGPLE